MVVIEELADLLSHFKQGGTKEQVAKKMGWSVHKVTYWIKRMKDDGVEVPIKKGPKPLDVKTLK